MKKTLFVVVGIVLACGCEESPPLKPLSPEVKEILRKRHASMARHRTFRAEYRVVVEADGLDRLEQTMIVRWEHPERLRLDFDDKSASITYSNGMFVFLDTEAERARIIEGRFTEFVPLIQWEIPQLLFPYRVEDLVPFHELQIVDETDESIRLRGRTVLEMGPVLGDRHSEEVVLRKSDDAASEIELFGSKWILKKLELGVEFDPSTFEPSIPDDFEVERTTVEELKREAQASQPAD